MRVLTDVCAQYPNFRKQADRTCFSCFENEHYVRRGWCRCASRIRLRLLESGDTMVRAGGGGGARTLQFTTLRALRCGTVHTLPFFFSAG